TSNVRYTSVNSLKSFNHLSHLPWDSNLQHILMSPQSKFTTVTLYPTPYLMGLEAFRWFLRSEFSEENLEFWLACEDYRSTAESQLGAKAHGIYSQFINSQAPQEVNLDSETREAVTNMLRDPRADAFNNAQQQIYTLMSKDSFPRFLRSSYYQEMLVCLCLGRAALAYLS
uniref:Si:ch211-196h16.12 n=1 Tax=Scleropages formosus TaxID=113540 RepID=A0A8C9W0A5_SCLFO